MSNGDQILRSYLIISSLRSYSIISSLRENIPNTHMVSDQWVKEFHGAIKNLEESIGIDLNEFKVPQENIRQTISSSNSITGEVRYRKGLWCERSLLIHKIASILMYFTGLNSGQEKKIGFSQ